MSTRTAVIAGIVGIVACTAARVAPPRLDTRTIAVAPTRAPTDADLVIVGTSLLDRLAGREPLEVPAAVDGEARSVLRERGFEVVAPGTPEAPVLHVEIQEWEPDLPHPSFILVTVDARLTEASGARVLWSERRARWHVPTRGEPSVRSANGAAVRTIVRALLGGWSPAARSD
jgi:hypothetical protein